MKRFLILYLALFSFPVLAIDNQLTAEEKASGWTLLFNGKDLSQWRNFNKQQLNPQWVIKDEAIHLTGKNGGDIVTKKSYQNFILKLDWKISIAGNSGIFLFVDEEGQKIYSHAPEIQILDNERHHDNKVDSHLSGSLYDLIASPEQSHRAAGKWNQVTVLFQNSRLEVWQNQMKTIDIVIGSKRWHKLIATSKFSDWDGFGIKQTGYIGLQDHGDPVSFKNIKIKEIK